MAKDLFHLDYKASVKLCQLIVLLQIHSEVREMFQNLKIFLVFNK